jgi:hypothetical protein
MASTSLSIAAGFTRGAGTCIAMATRSRESGGTKTAEALGQGVRWFIYPSDAGTRLRKAGGDRRRMPRNRYRNPKMGCAAVLNVYDVLGAIVRSTT